MKKTPIILSLSVAFALALTYVYLNGQKPAAKSLAIVTTLSHPALDHVRQGIKTALANGTLKDVALIDFNAEGNAQQANLIARKISKDQHILGIFAIGTLAAQAMAKVEKTRPIVIAAVSDPKVIIADTKADNICGLSDSIDANYQIDTVMKLLPHIKRLALLYSTNEANSISVIKQLSGAAAQRNLSVSMVGIHEPQQIMAASLDACQKNDAILIPLDNQLVASMPAVIKATRSLFCAVITTNESPIHQGASLAFGVDYQKSGQTAGRIMEEIVAGHTTTRESGFIDPSSVDIFVNDAVVKEKGLDVDMNAAPNIVHVQGGAR